MFGRLTERRAQSSRDPSVLGDQSVSQASYRKVLRFGDVLTNFVRLIGFAGISQQKLGRTSQIQADQRISR